MRHTQESRRSRPRREQGFASMSPSEKRRIASEGDRARREYRDYDERDRSYSFRDEDYDNYRNYDDIEDEGYERDGYARSGGRGGAGRGYSFRDRDYDEEGYDFDEGYRDENVRGRRGFDAMDPEERHAISSRDRRSSPVGGRGRSNSNRTTRY